jgi:hypothetical protein
MFRSTIVVALIQGSLLMCVGIAAADPAVTGPIGERYHKLGGISGALGRPTSSEKDATEGKGRYQTFEHGAVGISPTTGPKSVQSVYFKAGELVFEWGDTAPFNYDYFIVRWDLNGKNIGQQDVKGGPRTHGRFVLRPKEAGRYRLVVEGRDGGLLGGKSRQGWSIPLYIDVVPPKPWAIILCKFHDEASEPHPPAFYRASFTEAGAGTKREFDYFREVSYGRLDMTGSKVFGWFNMPKHSTKDLAALKFPADRGKLADWGTAVAKDHRIDLSHFYGVVVVFNSKTDSGATGQHRVVLGYKDKDWSPTFNFHELGHGFDLDHSWSARPDIEYGDKWDIMSAMNCWGFKGRFGGAGPGMNAFNLKQLGSIPRERIWEPARGSRGGTITLAALSRPEAKGYLTAIIPPHDARTGSSILVEFRRKQGWDAGIPRDTILLHEVRSNGRCYLLSRTRSDGTKSPELLPNEDWTIPERGLTVKVKGFDTTHSTASLEVRITK